VVLSTIPPFLRVNFHVLGDEGPPVRERAILNGAFSLLMGAKAWRRSPEKNLSLILALSAVSVFASAAAATAIRPLLVCLLGEPVPTRDWRASELRRRIPLIRKSADRVCEDGMSGIVRALAAARRSAW
jgi:hypothetical protein